MSTIDHEVVGKCNISAEREFVGENTLGRETRCFLCAFLGNVVLI